MKRCALAMVPAMASIVILPCIALFALRRTVNPIRHKASDRSADSSRVLNRLAFGPRPGDVEAVRRIGLEKWIDLQLHPDRIVENPDRLKPNLSLMKRCGWILRTVLKSYVQPRR